MQEIKKFLGGPGGKEKEKGESERKEGTHRDRHNASAEKRKKRGKRAPKEARQGRRKEGRAEARKGRRKEGRKEHTEIATMLGQKKGKGEGKRRISPKSWGGGGWHQNI